MNIQALLYALGFLTRIPVPVRVFANTEARAASVAWYPLVGLVLASALLTLAWLLQGQQRLLSASLMLALWVGLTGALHLDGLADSADAWIGGLGDRERTLTIMKDPRCGPAAVVAIGLVLLLKLAALQALPLPTLGRGLWLAPLWGRAALTGLLLTTPYAREQGMASGLQTQRCGLVWALLASAGLSLLAGYDGLLAIIAAGVVFSVWRGMGLRRLGGYTGDTAGAMAELVELAVLLILALRHG